MFRKELTCFSRIRVPFALLMFVPLLLALAVLPVRNATACDDGGQTGFMIQAPLDSAATCTATSSSISVLGLSIDISKASLGEEH